MTRSPSPIVTLKRLNRWKSMGIYHAFFRALNLIIVLAGQVGYTKSARTGEYGWDGAASTHFCISPKDDLAVVVLTQYMPFSFLLEDAMKPLVYDAIVE